MKITEAQRDDAVAFFKDVQDRLLAAFEKIDGNSKAERTEWDRPGGGGGRMGVLRGKIVEKAGANVSIVHGAKYPNMESEFAGKPFFASGVSTITHMYNPYAPIGHMNVRIFTVGDTFWFGGGADLTPFMKFEEDTNMFHAALQKACEKHTDSEAYEKYKKWCDEYFYIKHRKSIRGVGGIFFDQLKGDFDTLFPFVKAVANAYVETFPKILEKRKDTPFTEEEKDGQLFWRGRYAEFNLVYDRGTKFGLESDGHIEAIFVSMPPMVKW
jgi:coproporphyrinogen III oxidase